MKHLLFDISKTRQKTGFSKEEVMTQTRSSINYNGEKISPKADGHIGSCDKFSGGSFLTLTITVPNNGSVLLFEKDREGLREIRSPLSETDKSLTYQRKFLLCNDTSGGPMSGWLYPRMKHNNSNFVYIVEFKPNGYFRMYEVGFMSQNENLFFAKQFVREGFAEKESFLEGLTPRSKNDIPDLHLEDNVARIIWFNLLSGVGCLMTRRLAIRIHWSELIAMRTRLKFLCPGDYLVYNRLGPSSDPRTKFEFEVAGGAMKVKEKPSLMAVGQALSLLKTKTTKTLGLTGAKGMAFAKLQSIFDL
ncbi:hypothetical protein L6259_00635 [Candidatus Parcubacteria bacterium]|nr:hypothetical protein [Patescibacteria group bacterium]MCG2693779.1 hypothetical protein [Candidatus Parcubacteria bacterium]